jgi:CHAT domain-containing protein/tetratricopeptide (TPR) repeat protein
MLRDPVFADFIRLTESGALGSWMASAPTEARFAMIVPAQSLSVTYRDGNRDTITARRWAEVHLELARSLPDDYGPESNQLGVGRDSLICAALSGLAKLAGMQGTAERAYALLREAERYHDQEQERRRRSGSMQRPAVERLMGGGSGAASLYGSLARAAWQVGDERAAAHYRHLEIEHSLDDRSTNGETAQLMQKGRYWIDQGNPERALSSFRAAVDVAERDEGGLFNGRILAAALSSLGETYGTLGVPRSALAALARARDLVAESGKSGLLARIELAEARVLRKAPRHGSAIDRYISALELISQDARPGDPHAWTASDGRHHRVIDLDDGFDLAFEIAGFLRESGDLARASELLDLATDLGETVRGAAVDETSRLAAQEQRSQALVAQVQVQIELARTTGSQDHKAAAWAAIETLRARTFLDMAGDVPLAAPAEVPSELASAEANLLAHRRLLRESRQRDAAFWHRYDDAEAALASVWRAIATSGSRAREYVAVREARPAAPAEVSLALAGSEPAPSGGAVAVNLFFQDDETLALLAVGSTDEQVRITSSRIDRTRLTRFISANFGSASRVRELAEDLEDLFHHELADVVAPLVDLCEPGSTLVLAPAGPLHNVPLGAVRLGDDVLIARNPIVFSPSISLVRSWRLGADREGPLRHAVFGDPTDDLPGARDEALELARRWGADPRIGAGATAAALLTALGGGGLVHVAAHAEFSAEDPLASGIRMADRTLTAREILRLRAADLGLVTLSACESAVYQARQSEDPMGLPRALLFAGASSVLASLWRVPDSATRNLMSLFYSALQDGSTKAEALRSAALQARDDDGRLDRWAGFVLLGSWI